MQTEEKIKIIPNKLQGECIDNIQGQYLVLAGPGTGKTFTLVNRVSNMLKKGIDAKKILCLTFSDAAANEMKSRLAKDLGVLDCGVDIFTFHGFCSEIINSYPEDFDISPNIRVITKAASTRLIKECIEEINPVEYRSKKNDPYIFIKKISDGIEEIQKYRLNKKEFFENIEKNPAYKPAIIKLEKEIEKLKTLNKDVSKKQAKIDDLNKKIDKAKELWQFYELYKTKMQEEKYIDFCDMINLVLEKFEQKPAFLDRAANKYEYILVDEYQDTNKAQNEIIFQIVNAQNAKNVFVVGDDEQIIYTFQGARLDTMEQFLKKFPNTKVICLKENMRSTQSILDLSRKVALQDENRLEANDEFKKYNIDKELIAKNEKLKTLNSKVRCTKYYNQEQEYIAIVDEIENLINSNKCPTDKNGKKDLSQIAVLSREHKDLRVFSQLFKNRNIPYDCKSSKSIFEINSSIVLYYYLKMLTNPQLNSDKIYKLLLLEPFKINPVDFVKLHEKSSVNISFIDSMKEIDDFIEKDKIEKFIETFKYLEEYQTNECLKNIVLEVGSKTGIFDYYLNSETNKSENILGIKKLVDEAQDFSDSNKKCLLYEFVEYLDMAYSENIDISIPKPPIDLNGVQLCTYYASKGKEYECVYMPTLNRNKWEADRNTFKINVPVNSDDYKTDDELEQMRKSDRIKLLFVGMTRAKHTLRLSYVENISSKTSSISEYLTKILPDTEEIDCSQYTNQNYEADCKKELIKRSYDYKRDFKTLIDSKLNNRAFSPSAFNKYLNCPRQYLYDDVLNLASKAAFADSAVFGSCVHSAVEFVFKKAIKNNIYPSCEEFIETFKKELSSHPLSSIQKRKILEKRGCDALNGFYQKIINTPLDSVKEIEYKLNFNDGKYKFYGIIDRIDKNSNGTYTIIDYKTGSAKTAKMINPDGSKKDYYYQIALYKYFCEKQNNIKIEEVCFVFPEEPENNLYLKLSDEECAEVYDKFKNTIDDIYSCKFEPSYDKNVCKYCEYKDYCKLDIV